MLRRLAPGLLWAALAAAGCTETTSLALTIVGDGEGVARYTLRVYASSECPSADHMARGADRALGVVHEQSYVPGGGARVGELDQGVHSFALLGRARSCEPYRFGCDTVRIGAAEEITIPLAPVVTPLLPCADGTACDGAGACRECAGGVCPPPTPRMDASIPSPDDGGAGDDGASGDGTCTPDECERCLPESCPGQTCCEAQETFQCATLAYDPRHCGTCDRPCNGEEQVCRQGECFARVPRQAVTIDTQEIPFEESAYRVVWWLTEAGDSFVLGNETGPVQGPLDLLLATLSVPPSEDLVLGAVVFGPDLDGDRTLGEAEIRLEPFVAQMALVWSPEELPPGGATHWWDPRFVFPEGITPPDRLGAYEVPGAMSASDAYDLRLVVEGAPPERFTLCYPRESDCPLGIR